MSKVIFKFYIGDLSLNAPQLGNDQIKLLRIINAVQCMRQLLYSKYPNQGLKII